MERSSPGRVSTVSYTIHYCLSKLFCLKLFIYLNHAVDDALVIKGVALLPFVDERRLRAALEKVYPDLTPDEGEC